MKKSFVYMVMAVSFLFVGIQTAVAQQRILGPICAVWENSGTLGLGEEGGPIGIRAFNDILGHGRVEYDLEIASTSEYDHSMFVTLGYNAQDALASLDAYLSYMELDVGKMFFSQIPINPYCIEPGESHFKPGPFIKVCDKHFSSYGRKIGQKGASLVFVPDEKDENRLWGEYGVHKGALKRLRNKFERAVKKHDLY